MSKKGVSRTYLPPQRFELTIFCVIHVLRTLRTEGVKGSQNKRNDELGPKASCSWGKGKYYKLFTYKGVSFRMAYSLITACPYMRIKSVILIKV